MNTYIKQIFILLLLAPSSSYNMGAIKKGLGYIYQRPGETISRITSYPLYREPFAASFAIDKSAENAEHFIIKIQLPGQPPLHAKYAEKALVSDKFLDQGMFIYSTFPTKYKEFEDALIALQVAGTLSNTEKNNISTAWESLKNKLNAYLIEDINNASPTLLSGGEKIPSKLQGYMQVNIGGYSPLSRFWTRIYNDIVDFAAIIWVDMPRTHGLVLKGVSATTELLAGGPKRKVVWGLFLASGLGYLTYKYWNQIPSLSDIGGGIEQTGRKVTSWGEWLQGSKATPAKSPNITPSPTSIQIPPKTPPIQSIQPPIEPTPISPPPTEVGEPSFIAPPETPPAPLTLTEGQVPTITSTGTISPNYRSNTTYSTANRTNIYCAATYFSSYTTRNSPNATHSNW